MTSNDVTTSIEPKDEAQESKGKIRPKRRFIGFSEQLEMKRQKNRNKPRSWVERKLVVPIVIGIAGYATYVYIGRFCVPMLRRDANAMGGRGMGVAFTIVFCLSALMFWWTYIKLLFTPPGFAKDFVPKTVAPQSDYVRSPPSLSRSRGYDSDIEDEHWEEDLIGGTPYAEISPPSSHPPSHEGPSTQQNQSADLEKQADPHVPSAPHRSPALATRNASDPKRKLSKKRTPLQMSESHDSSHARNDSGGERNTDETAVAPTVIEPAPPHTLSKQANTVGSPYAKESQAPHNARNIEEGLPPPMYSRRPPTHPSLLPEYRYCYTEGLVKPMRAHHCRVCGTCVLMYDHHCPWIGGCVGAHNHKFFVNFLEWCTLWALWMFATLVALQARSGSDSNSDVDPQIIVIIALSAFFLLFTGVLLVAHIRMIILNQTSVESMGVSSMRERERALLRRMVPVCDWRRRKAILREWDEDWGDLNTEGNIWWLGNARTNWEYRMGKNQWGWFLPIGKSEGDGLTYPTNPRFDKDGRWRKRIEWPPELR